MNMYVESGRNIHRIVAVILAVTTWIFVYNITEHYVPICILTAALEFSAYKTLSNRTQGVNPAYYRAAVIITVSSSLLSLIGGFLLESSIKSKSAKFAIEKANEYSQAATNIMAANEKTMSAFESTKEKQIARINQEYDNYQAAIGTPTWKTDFAKNPSWYRRFYSPKSSPGRWVVMRDSLEREREGKIALVNIQSIPEGYLAKVPTDYSSSLLSAGMIMGVASRYAIILIDLFCFFIVLSIIRNENEEEQQGITDFLLIIPSLIGNAARRWVEPIVIEEETKDAQLEADLEAARDEIEDFKLKEKALREEVKMAREKEIGARLERIDKSFEVTEDGAIEVDGAVYSHKKSLQTAISRFRRKGDERKVRKLQEALEEFNKRHEN